MRGNSAPQRLYVTWYRCVVDHMDHAVTDEEFAEGVHLRTGRYHTLCCHELVIDSCLTQPGRPCPTCNALIQHHNEQTAEPPRTRKRDVFSRLLKTPAVPLPRSPQRPRFIPQRGGRTTTPAGVGSAPTQPTPADFQPSRVT